MLRQKTNGKIKNEERMVNNSSEVDFIPQSLRSREQKSATTVNCNCTL